MNEVSTSSGDDADKPTGRAVAVPISDDLNESETTERTLVERDQRAQLYIEPAPGFYWQLKQHFSPVSETDGHDPGENLFEWGTKFPDYAAKRLGLMRKFFRYRRDFFQFAKRAEVQAAEKAEAEKNKTGVSKEAPTEKNPEAPQRNAVKQPASEQEGVQRPPFFYLYWQRLANWASENRNSVFSLFLRPSTHADIAEEDLEWKLPDDKGIRAAIRAVTLIVEYNQLRHIHNKRMLQLGCTLIYAAIAVAWCFGGSFLIGALTQVDATVAAGIWVAVFLVMSAIVIFGARDQFILKLDLTTNYFRTANQTSCDRLRLQVAEMLSRIRTRVVDLLDVLKSSLPKEHLLMDKSWPKRAKGIFKLAMWEGRRAEAIEECQQLQMERLRKFYLVSDWLGNFSSILLCVIISGGAFIATGGAWLAGLSTFWQAAIVSSCVIAAAVHFSRLSTSAKRSFNISDIEHHTAAERWSEFSPESTAPTERGREHIYYYRQLSDAYRVVLNQIASDRQAKKNTSEIQSSHDLHVWDSD